MNTHDSAQEYQRRSSWCAHYAASVAGELEAVVPEEEEDAEQEEAWREGGSGYYVGCRAHAAHGVRSARPLSHICRSAREEHRKRNFLPRIVESTAGGDGVRGES